MRRMYDGRSLAGPSAQGRITMTTAPSVTDAAAISQHEAGQIERAAATGHALTIDGGWREVADTALAFVRRFA
jgi:hypothetical protein